MKKKVKVLIIVLATVLTLIILSLAALGAFVGVVAVGAYNMFAEKLAAASSIQKLDKNLYIMEYRGDYGLDEFIEQGGAADSDALASYLVGFISNGFYTPEVELEENAYGCSTISAKRQDGVAVTGRNYDWEECAAMIVHTVPDDGYESVSTACLDFLGFEEGWTPEGTMNGMMAIAAIYIPLDGINEKGLFVADLMAGDNEETHQNTDAADVTTTVAIRLMLDHAANVDEALEILRKYDMNSDIGSAHHYAISDASGRSVVVEYVNGEMIVKETHVVTNHYLTDSPKKGIGSDQSLDRYLRLEAALALSGGVMNEYEISEALRSVTQGAYDHEYELTMWSTVYAQAEGEISARFYFKENFDEYYRLTLGDNDRWIEEYTLGAGVDGE